MPREESRYPADWLRIGEKDFRRAEHLLGIQDFEAAGFYLQQAKETPCRDAGSVTNCDNRTHYP
jgi:hypothetical protein